MSKKTGPFVAPAHPEITYPVRFDKRELYSDIKVLARREGRSMNSEMLWRLHFSMQDGVSGPIDCAPIAPAKTERNYPLRFVTKTLYEDLVECAGRANRSVNSEILARLYRSIDEEVMAST